MFDGFSSLLKPENTSEFSPRFSVSFSRGRRNEFSLSSLQVASGENFWGFCEAIEKSRGNRKKLVIAMLWGDGGLRSAAVEIRGPSTQNPPLATAYRFESGHRHQEQRICAAGPLLFSLNGQKKIRILKLWSFGRGSAGVRLSSAIPLLHLRRSDKQHCIPRKIYKAVRACLSSPFRPQSK